MHGSGLPQAPWPAWRLAPRPAGSWLFALLALSAILWLHPWPAFAQSSSAPSLLGASSFQTFLADCAIVKAQLENYRASYAQALSVNASISAELQSAKDELQSFRESSTQSYSDLSQRVEMLTQRLSESDTLVNSLLSSLESKQKEYEGKLRRAEDRAARLDRALRRWRAGALGAGAAALILGIVLAAHGGP